MFNASCLCIFYSLGGWVFAKLHWDRLCLCSVSAFLGPLGWLIEKKKNRPVTFAFFLFTLCFSVSASILRFSHQPLFTHLRFILLPPLPLFFPTYDLSWFTSHLNHLFDLLSKKETNCAALIRLFFCFLFYIVLFCFFLVYFLLVNDSCFSKRIARKSCCLSTLYLPVFIISPFLSCTLGGLASLARGRGISPRPDWTRFFMVCLDLFSHFYTSFPVLSRRHHRLLFPPFSSLLSHEKPTDHPYERGYTKVELSKSGEIHGHEEQERSRTTATSTNKKKQHQLSTSFSHEQPHSLTTKPDIQPICRRVERNALFCFFFVVLREHHNRTQPPKNAQKKNETKHTQQRKQNKKSTFSEPRQFYALVFLGTRKLRRNHDDDFTTGGKVHWGK